MTSVLFYDNVLSRSKEGAVSRATNPHGMNKKELLQLQKAVVQLTKSLSPRNRDILSRRFGLSSGRRETLESIGKSYGITRERVRQIEEFSLAQLTKSFPANRDIQKYVGLTKAVLARAGGVMREADFFTTCTGSSTYTPANAALVFLASLTDDVLRYEENDTYHAFWTTGREHADATTSLATSLISAFNARKAVVASDALHSFALEHGINSVNGSQLSPAHLATCQNVCKHIQANIFGQVGLSHWPEVRPKGVRDKAYLIMKREGAPQHFTQIAKFINQAKFSDGKKVNIQTVHNELIKDSRFVLVGRGLYALAEWGYKPGTVKEVLRDILKKTTKPLTKADLVAKVKEARLVKDNTILLNLQDSKTFTKRSDGTYMLRRT